MADLAELPPDSWARIELAKLSAGEKLRQDLAQARDEKLRRDFTEKVLPGAYDDEALLQKELNLAYADYILEIFFAEVEERLKHGTELANLPHVLDEILRKQFYLAVPLWASSGGKAECLDFMVFVYKVVRSCERYKDLLKGVASTGPAPENAQLAATVPPARSADHSHQEPRPAKTRGRPITYSDELKAAAQSIKDSGGGNRGAAEKLYGAKYPTPQQVKNISTILREYRKKKTKQAAPSVRGARKARKSRG